MNEGLLCGKDASAKGSGFILQQLFPFTLPNNSALEGRKSLMSNHLFSKIHCFLLAYGNLWLESCAESWSVYEWALVLTWWWRSCLRALDIKQRCGTGKDRPRPGVLCYWDLKFLSVSSQGFPSPVYLWYQAVTQPRIPEGWLSHS